MKKHYNDSATQYSAPKYTPDKSPGHKPQDNLHLVLSPIANISEQVLVSLAGGPLNILVPEPHNPESFSSPNQAEDSILQENRQSPSSSAQLNANSISHPAELCNYRQCHLQPQWIYGTSKKAPAQVQTLQTDHKSEPMYTPMRQKTIKKKLAKAAKGDNRITRSSSNLNMLMVAKPVNRHCNCINSQCLKNYCECYRVGNPCGPECFCVGCENTGCDRDGPSVTKGYCNCLRSQCNKKYCVCLEAGRACGQHCRCLSCKNRVELPSVKSVIKYEHKEDSLLRDREEEPQTVAKSRRRRAPRRRPEVMMGRFEVSYHPKIELKLEYGVREDC